VAIRHKAGTIAGSMAVLSLAFTGIANAAQTQSASPQTLAASAKTLSFNQQAATYVKTFIGKVPYTYGGASPSAGFDCSGLTSYVYGHLGKSIPRTAEAQFEKFKRISKSQAWGGDLVFYHETSSPTSYVYHVGIYEGGNGVVSAANESEGIVQQSIYSSYVTFGTITH
jgi:cell wall-associated NlpC family hydrolase